MKANEKGPKEYVAQLNLCGLSYSEIARQLGVSRQVVYYLGQGKRAPRYENFAAIKKLAQEKSLQQYSACRRFLIDEGLINA